MSKDTILEKYQKIRMLPVKDEGFSQSICVATGTCHNEAKTLLCRLQWCLDRLCGGVSRKTFAACRSVQIKPLPLLLSCRNCLKKCSPNLKC